MAKQRRVIQFLSAELVKRKGVLFRQLTADVKELRESADRFNAKVKEAFDEMQAALDGYNSNAEEVQAFIDHVVDEGNNRLSELDPETDERYGPLRDLVNDWSDAPMVEVADPDDFHWIGLEFDTPNPKDFDRLPHTSEDY